VTVKRAVYLDSTIPSYLFEERVSLQTYVEVTQRWWEEAQPHCDLWVSDETIAEVSRGEYPNKTKILECVSRIAVLAPPPYLIDIAHVSLTHDLMPRTFTGDALHLADASYDKMDFVLTWNCQP